MELDSRRIPRGCGAGEQVGWHPLTRKEAVAGQLWHTLGTTAGACLMRMDYARIRSMLERASGSAASKENLADHAFRHGSGRT